jgi:hypothetical protein
MPQELIKKILEVIFPQKAKQSKLFICVKTLLAHQVLGNASLLLNQLFCFTVIELCFPLVVYSLYRELKGTAPSNYVRRFWQNNTY